MGIYERAAVISLRCPVSVCSIAAIDVVVFVDDVVLGQAVRLFVGVFCKSFLSSPNCLHAVVSVSAAVALMRPRQCFVAAVTVFGIAIVVHNYVHFENVKFVVA